VISLWSANSGIKALFDALNVVYEEKEKRSFIRLNAITLAFTIGTIAFLLIALACVVALPVVVNYLPLPQVTSAVLTIAPWPVLLVLVAFWLTLIYRYGPSRTQPRWQWVSWGSALAAIAWLAASALFSWYAASFGSFNKTYGSLGAIIGFMLWMWLSIIVVLIGGKLNAEIELRRRAKPLPGAPNRSGGGAPKWPTRSARRAPDDRTDRDSETGDVASRPRQAFHEPGAHRIACRRYHWDRRGQLFDDLGDDGARSENQIGPLSSNGSC